MCSSLSQPGAVRIPTLRSTFSLQLSVLAFLLSAFAAFAELIPADRLPAAGWRPGVTVGVLGGIPANRAVYTTLSVTNGEDITAKLQGALDSCPAGKIVQIPAGTFTAYANHIYLRPWITLRGAGSTGSKVTEILTGGDSFRLDTDNATYNIPQQDIIQGGLMAGSTNLVLTNTTGFTVGGMAMIAQFSSTNQFETPLIVALGGTNAQSGYIYRTWVRVMAKTATSITFWPPLYGDMSARHARVLPSGFVKGGMGLEDLYLHANGAQFVVSVSGLRDSWIKNVRVRGAANYSVNINDCVGFEMRDCFLDDQTHGALSSNGAGLLTGTMCASLIENNIIHNSFPCMELNAGSCGNVYAYNFLLNTNTTIEIDSNHGGHNAYNLFEGNITGRYMSDGYFGSEAYSTIYRNWINGQADTNAVGTTIGYLVALKRWSHCFSVVGNIMGSPAPYTMAYDGGSYGQPNMGNAISSGFGPPWANWGTSQAPGTGFQELDTNVQATLVRKGNFNFHDKAIPPSESLGNDSLPSSLYLKSKPAWFGDLAWPPFDPTNPNPSFESIPAGYRYVHGTPPPGIAVAPSAPTNLKLAAKK